MAHRKRNKADAPPDSQETAVSPSSAQASAPARRVPDAQLPTAETPAQTPLTPLVGEAGLAGLLFRLLRRTLEKARDTIPQLPKEEVIYVKPKYSEYKYGEGGGISSTHSQVFERRTELQSKFLAELVEKTVDVQGEYGECAREITAIYGLPMEQARGHLRQLVTFVVKPPVRLRERRAHCGRRNCIHQ
jgi:hypothetical protein